MTTAHLEDIRDQIVLARTPANPLAPPDVFATTIATIQSNLYVHRVSRIFDFAILALTIVAAGFVGRIARSYIVLGAIAFSCGLLFDRVDRSFLTGSYGCPAICR